MSFSLRPVCRPCRVVAVLLAAALLAAGPAHPEAAPSGEWRQLNGQSTTAVLWQRQAAEYRALCHQAFQLADRRVYSAVLRLSGFRRVPPHPRYHPDRERLAVVLDLDETLLDNGPYLAAVAQSDTAGRERLALLVETIGATGIRVSEVRYITLEAVEQGKAEIALKGKIRTILLPGKLCRKLRKYAQKQKIASGAVFRAIFLAKPSKMSISVCHVRFISRQRQNFVHRYEDVPSKKCSVGASISFLRLRTA